MLKKNPDAKLLSGGTDLSLEVTKSRKEIKKIIYLNSIKELDFIYSKKNEIEVGAGTSLLKFEKIIKKYYPDFNRILKRYGSVQIRNVGTIAGNIATASPIGDTLPILLSLDTKIILDGPKKRELIPLNKFFISYRQTKLKKGQFILVHKNEKISLNIFGKHNMENMEAARQVCQEIGVCESDFYKSIKNFKGASRRLNLIKEIENHSAVYYDFAHYANLRK